MAVIDQKSDEKRFNETVQRMLKTLPKSHDEADRAKVKGKPKDRRTEKLTQG
jgi:hypothetical protein